MAKILVVLPYSGTKVGGGLANVNEELCKALAASGEHEVKLLTVKLPAHSAPDPERHGRTQIVFIQDPAADAMVNPGRIDDERTKLYQIINTAPDNVNSPAGLGLADWTPDIIIGHSRFSGPAAIKLRDKFYNAAKVFYFIHSVPAEGVIVHGQGIVSSKTAADKQAQELQLMRQADVVVPVGPLIRMGVQKIIKDGGGDPEAVRMHEFIAGIEMTGEPVEFIPPDLNGRPYVFLMVGRAEAPLKGFQDMILAAMELRDQDTNIMLRIRGYNTDRDTLEKIQQFVNEVTNPGDGMRERIQVLPFGDQEDVRLDVRKVHGVLMPSYFEHFGLAPMAGVEAGVPILVNELSGFGMFVNDPLRFDPALGGPCVVHDFAPEKPRPLGIDDIWGASVPDAFDTRPTAWAKAMMDLTVNLKDRFADARKLRQVFTGYTWPDTVTALLAAADKQYNGKTTLQSSGGALIVVAKKANK